jgi:hypothetical protein
LSFDNLAQILKSLCMTIELLLKKLLNYFWIVVIVAVVTYFVSAQAIKNDEHYANITVSSSITGSLTPDTQVSDRDYGVFQTALSKYILARFSSPAMQNAVLSKTEGKSEISLSKVEEKTPLYGLTDQGLGAVSISYMANDKGAAEKFIENVKLIFNEQIVTDWNQNKPAAYQLKPQTNFVTSITKAKSVSSTSALYTMIAALAAVVVVAFLPSR